MHTYYSHMACVYVEGGVRTVKKYVWEFFSDLIRNSVPTYEEGEFRKSFFLRLFSPNPLKIYLFLNWMYMQCTEKDDMLLVVF